LKISARARQGCGKKEAGQKRRAHRASIESHPRPIQCQAIGRGERGKIPARRFRKSG
jgi:hypothetical protein